MTETRHTTLPGTPALEQLLAALRRRIVMYVWLHGVGTTAAAGAAWLLFAFFADWGLRVPEPVRVFHGLVFLGVLAFFLWRELVRPLRRLPNRPELAVILERSHPELKELLVSAAQFQLGRAGTGDTQAHGSPELIERVLAEADRRAADLATTGVLDERMPRARFWLGTLATALLTVMAVWNPLYARIFLDRLLGSSVPWPQRTHLQLTIPLYDASARIESSESLVRVFIARGTDVPVKIEVDGVVPSDVTLHIEGGRDRVLSPSGGGVFRTLLPTVGENVAFYATGGDDRDGKPRVEIEVLQPPDVEQVAVRVEPPAYTDLPATTERNRDVEVIAGSRVFVHVLPTPRDARGTARLLPDDREVKLVPAPFPVDPEAAETGEGSGEGGGTGKGGDGLMFELVAEKSLGYRFELTDSTGLSNPDPGLFRILVVEDRPPEVRVLAPGRTDYETIAGGAIPLRARAEDDFGLVAMGFTVTPPFPSGDDEPAPPAILEQAFDLQLPAMDGGAALGRFLGGARIEVDDLARGEGLALDQRFELVVSAEDNHRPEPGVGRSLPVRIRVVSADEMLRRMQDRLARARLDAGRLAELQREKRRRVEELLDSINSDSPLEAGDTLALHGVLVGQRRVQADAEGLARDLSTVAGDVLYARLDDKAGALLEYVDARLAKIEDPGFHAEPWRELARAHAAGELGAPGFAGNLVSLVELALEISEDHTLAASAEIDRAQKAVDAATMEEALVRAVELQTSSLERIEDLLERLAEWDNFQNVLSLTRDILNRQKALRDRTRRFVKEKEQ